MIYVLETSGEQAQISDTEILGRKTEKYIRQALHYL
jgi:hypothetical protein